MKLVVCLITHDRLDYTKHTLANLRDNLTVPHVIVVVDNASKDGTQAWLKKEKGIYILLNKRNLYPGAACNQGWAKGLELMPDATHLMRCDNDMDFVKGFDAKAGEYFDKLPVLGQLGLDNTALDSWNGDLRWITPVADKAVNAWPGNVGGPCMIRREVWDKGARYDESPWQDLRTREDEMITPQEDVKFSLSMHAYGFIFGHPTEKLAWTFADESNWSDYPKYYEKTFKERGYKWQR